MILLALALALPAGAFTSTSESGRAWQNPLPQTNSTISSVRLWAFRRKSHWPAAAAGLLGCGLVAGWLLSRALNVREPARVLNQAEMSSAGASAAQIGSAPAPLIAQPSASAEWTTLGSPDASTEPPPGEGTANALSPQKKRAVVLVPVTPTARPDQHKEKAKERYGF